MSLTTITLLGVAVFVVIVVLAVVVLISLREAGDPEQAPAEDLNELEESLVDRDVESDSEPPS